LIEEHRALINLLPFDVIITFAAVSVLLLAFASFVQRLAFRANKVPALLGAGSAHSSQRKTI